MFEVITGLFVTIVSILCLYYNALQEQKFYFLEDDSAHYNSVKVKKKKSKYMAFAKTFYSFIFKIKAEGDFW